MPFVLKTTPRFVRGSLLSPRVFLQRRCFGLFLDSARIRSNRRIYSNNDSSTSEALNSQGLRGNAIVELDVTRSYATETCIVEISGTLTSQENALQLAQSAATAQVLREADYDDEEREEEEEEVDVFSITLQHATSIDGRLAHVCTTVRVSDAEDAKRLLGEARSQIERYSKTMALAASTNAREADGEENKTDDDDDGGGGGGDDDETTPIPSSETKANDVDENDADPNWKTAMRAEHMRVLDSVKMEHASTMRILIGAEPFDSVVPGQMPSRVDDVVWRVESESESSPYPVLLTTRKPSGVLPSLVGALARYTAFVQQCTGSPPQRWISSGGRDEPVRLRFQPWGAVGKNTLSWRANEGEQLLELNHEQLGDLVDSVDMLLCDNYTITQSESLLPSLAVDAASHRGGGNARLPLVIAAAAAAAVAAAFKAPHLVSGVRGIFPERTATSSAVPSSVETTDGVEEKTVQK